MQSCSLPPTSLPCFVSILSNLEMVQLPTFLGALVKALSSSLHIEQHGNGFVVKLLPELKRDVYSACDHCSSASICLRSSYKSAHQHSDIWPRMLMEQSKQCVKMHVALQKGVTFCRWMLYLVHLGVSSLAVVSGSRFQWHSWIYTECLI